MTRLNKTPEHKPHSGLTDADRVMLALSDHPALEAFERLVEQYEDLKRLASPTAMTVIAEKVDAEIELLRLKEQLETLREAATAYLDHTENADYRRGHTNTACPPLTRAMCKPYMELRAVLYPADGPHGTVASRVVTSSSQSEDVSDAVTPEAREATDSSPARES